MCDECQDLRHRLATVTNEYNALKCKYLDIQREYKEYKMTTVDEAVRRFIKDLSALPNSRR